MVPECGFLVAAKGIEQRLVVDLFIWSGLHNDSINAFFSVSLVCMCSYLGFDHIRLVKPNFLRVYLCTF